MTSFDNNLLKSHLHNLVYSNLVIPELLTKLPQVKKQYNQFVKKNNLLNVKDNIHDSQENQIVALGKRFSNAFEFCKNRENSELLIKNLHQITDIQALFLSTNAFLTTIEMLGDTQQVQFWKRQLIQGRVIGAYAQTQLGHGSNVQNLQTQAHYQADTDEFKITTPKSSSIKFWPGVLGIHCSHVVLQAQTFIQNRSIGVQTFVIKIRNNKLQPQKNVVVGDIGSKLGMAKYDHGYLKLNNLRVPRRAFLMKYIKISKQGKVEGLNNSQFIKYGYGSMLNLRVYLAKKFGRSIINITHNTVRIFRQTNTLKNDQVEKQLFSYYCAGIGIIIANYQTSYLYNLFKKHLENKQYKLADKYLAEVHIASASIKTITGWKLIQVAKNVIDIHQLCFLKSSNLAQHLKNEIPAATYQGDNSVLLQQTGRYLLKLSYKKLIRPQLNLRNLSSIQKVLEYVVEQQVSKLKNLYNSYLKENDQLLVWNSLIQREIIDVAKLWSTYTLIKFYVITLQNNKQIQQFKSFYKKIGLVFSYSFLNNFANTLSLYGYKLDFPEIWREFNMQERESFEQCLKNDGQQQQSFSIQSQFLDSKGKNLENIVKSFKSKL